jgi:hypothetical protein
LSDRILIAENRRSAFTVAIGRFAPDACVVQRLNGVTIARFKVRNWRAPLKGIEPLNRFIWLTGRAIARFVRTRRGPPPFLSDDSGSVISVLTTASQIRDLMLS